MGHFSEVMRRFASSRYSALKPNNKNDWRNTFKTAGIRSAAAQLLAVFVCVVVGAGAISPSFKVIS
jgi:hypothetical protein